VENLEARGESTTQKMTYMDKKKKFVTKQSLSRIPEKFTSNENGVCSEEILQSQRSEHIQRKLFT